MVHTRQLAGRVDRLFATCGHGHDAAAELMERQRQQMREDDRCD